MQFDTKREKRASNARPRFGKLVDGWLVFENLIESSPVSRLPSLVSPEACLARGKNVATHGAERNV